MDHRLPGTFEGREFAWQVGEGGKRETFLVVAARTARPDVEALVRELQLAPEARARRRRPSTDSPPLRGVEGLVEDAPAPVTDGRIFRLAAALERERDPAVWWRRVHATHAPARGTP
jgi:hypothetical protein